MNIERTETGRAWVFGDNIDTDVLAPGRYMKAGIEEIARHCLEAVDPAFARELRPGDVVVGGRNFGTGSSREQAPQALKQLGVAALIAESFAGLFYRNALNLGLPALVCAHAKRLRPGDRLRVDAQAGRIDNLTTGETLACEPIPGHLMQMIRDGGLLPHLQKRLARDRLPT
ncbi:MAG: 3-isopropylmalate dehydratase [Betaproteobacteria bacterium]|nr:3-isopropylmalate dehydratase [Betaproteobacteria bacterium]